jgi:hypothetical protein
LEKNPTRVRAFKDRVRLSMACPFQYWFESFDIDFGKRGGAFIDSNRLDIGNGLVEEIGVLLVAPSQWERQTQ